MAKCICCKFDNCKAEFQRHRSNTSFSALDAQFSRIADLVLHPAEFKDKVCDRHDSSVKEWLDAVFAFYDLLKPGVYLTKIRYQNCGGRT